jgi:hypothetical protein
VQVQPAMPERDEPTPPPMPTFRIPTDPPAV